MNSKEFWASQGCNESYFDSWREAVYHPVRIMTLHGQPIRLRRGLIAALAAFAVISVGVAGQRAFADPAVHVKKHSLKEQVEALEEQWRVAQLAGDTGTMGKMLSDDYVGISMTGEVDTKAQQLRRVTDRRMVLTKIELSDMKVKLVGAVAIVTSQAQVEGTNDGISVQGTYRYTRIYRHLPTGQWRITSFEATREHHHRHDGQTADSQVPPVAPGEPQPATESK
ncbi:nuclear transport factor 2 family protein [Edaphobacter dinghuensis]|uniref:nuclear transport factor 2 family protein n=2 Tax=Edaphobacter dinghuensis TaxID=1560005 RepID=UPI0021DFC922|nr:nuclear transport factor 2 family protein [Edaphobacter dinghuensis]